MNTAVVAHEWTELFTPAKKMPPVERKEMRFADLSSINQDIQNSCSTTKSDSNSPEKALIQTVLRVTSKEKC